MRQQTQRSVFVWSYVIALPAGPSFCGSPGPASGTRQRQDRGGRWVPASIPPDTANGRWPPSISTAIVDVTLQVPGRRGA
ncbi:hypothetical protein VTJ04DRAFT_8499 [Mycothermus thermophilus]|uniref:uncharacterized protein n=1 Tax=Humicola insolens TaxID=85995 RepID=UPI003742AFA3